MPPISFRMVYWWKTMNNILNWWQPKCVKSFGKHPPTICNSVTAVSDIQLVIDDRPLSCFWQWQLDCKLPHYCPFWWCSRGCPGLKLNQNVLSNSWMLFFSPIWFSDMKTALAAIFVILIGVNIYAFTVFDLPCMSQCCVWNLTFASRVCEPKQINVNNYVYKCQNKQKTKCEP